MRVRATVVALTALALTIPAAAHAQRTVRTSSAPAGAQPIELGVDGQISLGMDDQGTTISLPAGKVRAGFFLGNVISIEPALGYNRFSNDGGSFSNLALDVSMLYHFGLDRRVNQYYVRPVVGLNRFSASDTDPVTGAKTSASSSNISLGVAGGLKMPLSDRLAFRGDLELRHTLADAPAPSYNALNLNFGISYFTR